LGNYRLALGTRLVEALDSRLKTAVLAFIIGLLFASTEFLVPVRAYFELHIAIMITGGAGISYLLLMGARARRLAFLEHLRKIAELNHNVRNALAVIQSTQYLSQDSAEQNRRIVLASVDRIDQTLSHLFPTIGERREDRYRHLRREMRRTSQSLPNTDDRRT